MEWIDDIKEWCIKTRSVQLDYYICMILRTVETDDEICVGHPQDFSLWIMMTMMIITNSAFIKHITLKGVCEGATVCDRGGKGQEHVTSHF